MPNQPRLRIAITNPYCWPQRRRGSERLLNDLSHWLAGRGHEVTVIATSPLAAGGRVEEWDGPVRRILLAPRAPFGLNNRWLSFLHSFGFQVRAEIRRGRFDAVQCLNYHDAWGVLSARGRAPAPRLVYLMAGIATRRYFRRIPHDGWMFNRVVNEAQAVLSVSRHAQDTMLAEYGVSSLLLPPPVDLTPYRAIAKPAPDGRLHILFTGDLTEPRKGALLLARAFALLRAERPTATLSYSGHVDAATEAAIRAEIPPDAMPDVTFHGVGRVEDLPGLYATATVVANPAVFEALGMVLIEALAAGTPVVGCDHGGIPDIIANPAVGRLFPPGPLVNQAASDAPALARAILEAEALAAEPATEASCRAHAETFSWESLGPACEAALLGLPPDPSLLPLASTTPRPG